MLAALSQDLYYVGLVSFVLLLLLILDVALADAVQFCYMCCLFLETLPV